MAIGATPGDILKMILRQGLGTVGIGLLASLVAAFAGTRLLADLFYGVTPNDPVTYAAVAALLLAVVTRPAGYRPGAPRALARSSRCALNSHPVAHFYSSGNRRNPFLQYESVEAVFLVIRDSRHSLDPRRKA